MAVWFLANAAANKMAGILSALYPDPSKSAPHLLGFEITGLYQFFMLYAFCFYGRDRIHYPVYSNQVSAKNDA